MSAFKYRAIDHMGKFIHGQMDALNEVDLELRLERLGQTLIAIKKTKPSSHLFRHNKISTKDLMIFCFELEQATSVGMPLIQTLIDLRDANNNTHFQQIIGALISDIESGKLISEALSKHPKIFDALFISLVVAGEKTGRLGEVFSHLSARYKWQSELASQTKRLLSYPLLVLVVMLATIVFLMTYLVPQMVDFLSNMGQSLPLQTRVLISISNFFVMYWWAILLMLFAVVSGCITLVKRNKKARYFADQFKISFPIFGVVWKKIILARFSRYFALMYQSGIPVLDAIKTCEEIVDNAPMKEALGLAHAQISAGGTIGESFQNTALFPPLVVRMIGIGERTGTLDQSLMKVAYFYDRDVNESIERALKLIEPVLTVILGLILAFIMMAVLGPVYDSFSQLKI